jgi:hypothetical protein
MPNDIFFFDPADATEIFGRFSAANETKKVEDAGKRLTIESVASK